MRRIGAVLLTLGVTAALCVTDATPSLAGPPPGQISYLPETIPNYFVTHPDKANPAPSSNSDVRIMADPARDLFFEFDAKQCSTFVPTNAAVFDLRTNGVVAHGCVDRLQPGAVAKSGAVLHFEPRAAAGQGGGMTAAVDSARGVFFFTADADTSGCIDGQHGTSPCVTPPQVAVFDERSLALADVWDLPVGAPPEVSGISLWASPDGRHRQVVVLADWGPQSAARPDGGIHLYAYDVDASLGHGAAATPVWDVAVTSCAGPISSEFSSMSAYRSRVRDRVYVPCEIGTAAGQSGHNGSAGPPARDGVVAIDLVPCASGMCPGDVTGQHATPAPGFFSGFVFDPGADRAFGLSNGLHAGITAFGYDGASREFVGRTSVGDKEDANGASIGIDTATGRLYGSGIGALTIVDGRRTPLAPGLRIPGMRGFTNRIDVIAVPPRPGRPYTRVLLPIQDCSSSRTDCRLMAFRVAADRIPVTTDPPLSALDANTYGGPLAGRDVSTTYTGDAGGFGVHAVWVGSANAMLGNATNPNDVAGSLGLPLGDGTRDLISAYVSRTALSSADAQSDATALAADDGTTDWMSRNAPSKWPHGHATCAYPGREARGSANAAGGDATTTCDGASPRRVAAAATFGGGLPGVPAVSVGSSRTWTTVTAPAGKDGVTGTVTSSVAGVRIAVGAGDEIRIAEVSHAATATATGRRGGAKAWLDPVVVRGLVVVTGGKETVVCPDACGSVDAAVAAISEAFPEYLRAKRGEADPELMKGSAGGYVAAVQPPAGWIDADRQFNAMGTEEASFVPALRIVLYDDGDALSRLVVDLAGVRVNAQQAVQALAQFQPYTQSVPTSTRTLREIAIPTPLGGFRHDAGMAPQRPSTVPAGGGVGAALVRVFTGFAFLLRSPGELASVAALLALLLAPALLMGRRRLWVRDALAD